MEGLNEAVKRFLSVNFGSGDGCGDGTADSASNSCDDADCISVKTVHDVLSFVSERPAWDRAML